MPLVSRRASTATRTRLVGMLRARPPKSPLQQTFPARQLQIPQLPRQFTPHAHTPATQHFVQRTFHIGFAMRKVLSLFGLFHRAQTQVALKQANTRKIAPDALHEFGKSQIDPRTRVVKRPSLWHGVSAPRKGSATCGDSDLLGKRNLPRADELVRWGFRRTSAQHPKRPRCGQHRKATGDGRPSCGGSCE